MPSLYNINAPFSTLFKAAGSPSKQAVAVGTHVPLCFKQSPFIIYSTLSSSDVLTAAVVSFSSKLAMY
ncbi:hypothetical protein Pyn_09965 [Prunus yedoensis var. nudiflora]|uniref:Uncharacterized protein n=1 Tax=Prunus yedoensis var. nudiflora TaxID=2094558 RepID=A0A314YWG6_PRUYE|nr:hypothetical protein Pyn_09965 [Prunus yedoensis var. nudiflora]